MKQKMVATKAFTYALRTLKVGDEFEALDDKDAMILSGIGNARMSTSHVRAHEATSEDEPVVPQRTLKLSTYKRRDMRAEGT